jgi:hypothetical protein
MRSALATTLLVLLVGCGAPRGLAPPEDAMGEAAGPFVIYASDSPIPLYHRDQAWRTFVDQGALGVRLLGEDDVEAYDWDDQALILKPGLGERLPLRGGKFIVLLGDQRLYGGVFLSPISQMAVDYPVIYLDRIGARTILFLRPTHDFARRTDPTEPAWAEIARPEVERRLAAIGKLRRPRSEPAFRAVEAAVARVRIVEARATADGLELDYELTCTRAGAYHVYDSISLRWGRYGASIGPGHEETITLAAGTTRRRASYPYRDLGAYTTSRREAGLARLPDGTTPAPVWSLSAGVRPILTEAERSAVGPVEELRLQPDRRGTSVLDDQQAGQVPVDWDRIGE